MKRILMLLAAVGMAACTTVERPLEVVDWRVAELPAIDSVMGAPVCVPTALGEAVQFDGDDAYYLGINPVQGMEELTIEVIFRQRSGAPFEQRFLHMGLINGERILFESRVNEDATWYLDTYINMDKETDLVLIDPAQPHPCDRWYNLAMVVADGSATSYVDGVEQVTGEIPFHAINAGITSVGVRQNKVCWFEGDLYRIRITPRALQPDEFLTDQVQLNEE